MCNVCEVVREVVDNLEVVEVTRDSDLKRFVLATLTYFSRVGYYAVRHGSPIGGKDLRYFICRDRIRKIPVCLMVTCLGNPLVLAKANLLNIVDPRKTLFLRRIFTIPPFNEENVASKCLNMLEELLRSEGHELIYSFTLPKHSGALYKHAGWVQGYRNKKQKITLYYKLLKPTK